MVTNDSGDVRHEPLTSPSVPVEDSPPVDPDPFTIGLAVFQLVAAGVAFLEQRRATGVMERQERDRFRAAWFGAYRSVNFFIRQVDEFETYALEDRFIGNPFRIGAVRLTVSHERKQALRRLRGQIMTTASRLGDDMDDLSYYLLPEDQGRISDILGLLSTVERLPESYGELIVLGRQVAELYREFLESIGEREGFKRAS